MLSTHRRLCARAQLPETHQANNTLQNELSKLEGDTSLKDSIADCDTNNHVLAATDVEEGCNGELPTTKEEEEKQ